MLPKITIITTVWNGADTILAAMRSVAAQRLEAGDGAERMGLEYIVVDGGSTDGTVDIIRRFERELLDKPCALAYDSFHWLSERDGGMYDGLNKGIRMATGDVVGILNSDDTIDGDSVVSRVAAEFARDDSAALDCLYGNVRFVNAAGKTTRVCFARFWRPWMLQWGYMPPHPSIFIRRDCFAKWGMYVADRAEYRIAADYELLIRFFRVHRMRARYLRVCTTKMLPGGLSTRDVEARRRLNHEIIKGNRVNGYFCAWPMLFPKYAIKIWEILLPRLGLMKG